MNLKFWEKKDIVQFDEGAGVYHFGTGAISAPKLKSYIQAFRICETIYSCIGLIQQAATLVPWGVYKETKDGKIEVKDNPLANFIKRPGDKLSWSRFVETYLGHLLLSGNVFMRFIIGSFGKYGETEFMRPNNVRPIEGPLGIARYDYYKKGRMLQIPEEEVLHIKTFNPEDDVMGLSPVATIAVSVDIDSFAKAWMLALLEKGARPPLTLVTQGKLTPEQRDFMKEQVKEQFLGYQNVMEPLILEGGIKVEKVGFSPQEVDFQPLTKTTLRKICNVYKIASELLGDSENKTYSNVKEAEKALYKKATLPHLAMLRDELNIGLVPKFDLPEGLFLDYDVSNLDALSEDLDLLWKRAGSAVDSGIITRNQARKMIKQEESKEKGADVLTVQATIVPLEMVAGESEEDIE